MIGELFQKKAPKSRRGCQPIKLGPAGGVMNEEGLHELRGQDWGAIGAKVLKTALCLAARYGWNAASSLPNGKSVEDLVLEAIAEIWANPGRIRRDLALTTQLTGIVRSKLWNLSQSADEDVARPDEFETVAVDGHKSSEAVVEDSDECARALELLSQHQKINGKDDHELVLTAISCGAWEVDDIVKETQLPRERVYQVRREIRELFPLIAGQLRNERKGRAVT